MPIKSLHLAFALSGLLACSGAAWAQGTWDDTHGRRDQVNDRLADQNERIQQERREHEISAERAQEQHRRDQDARAEERSMAAHDHGHITPGEQHQLNQQENHDSREIGR